MPLFAYIASVLVRHVSGGQRAQLIVNLGRLVREGLGEGQTQYTE